MANSRKPNPRPPYSFLRKRPIKPNWQAFFQSSLGNSSFRSYSRATPGNSPSANSLAAKRICFCRFVSSKSNVFSLRSCHQTLEHNFFKRIHIGLPVNLIPVHRPLKQDPVMKCNDSESSKVRIKFLFKNLLFFPLEN